MNRPFKQQQWPGRKIFRAVVVVFMQLLLVRVYRNFLAVFTKALECYYAFDQSEKSVILAATDVVAGMDLSTALTINDVTGFYAFAAELFAAKTLSA